MVPHLAAGLVLFAAAVAASPLTQTATPAADIAFIEKYLGAGVIGPPVAAGPIEKPSDWLAAGPTRMTFRVINPSAGSTTTEIEEFAAVPRPTPAPRWSLRAGSRVVSYLEASPDGGIGRISQFDSQHAVISRFAPPEAVIPAGIAPGQSVERTVAVTVSDAATPEEVKYRGSLRQTLTYVGAFQVTVPAGTFDAILLDVHIDGEVGPATIHDHVCFFFAKGIGRVASVEQKSVSAFLFYNKDERNGRVLVSREAIGG